MTTRRHKEEKSPNLSQTLLPKVGSTEYSLITHCIYNMWSSIKLNHAKDKIRNPQPWTSKWLEFNWWEAANSWDNQNANLCHLKSVVYSQSDILSGLVFLTYTLQDHKHNHAHGWKSEEQKKKSMKRKPKSASLTSLRHPTPWSPTQPAFTYFCGRCVLHAPFHDVFASLHLTPTQELLWASVPYASLQRLPKSQGKLRCTYLWILRILNVPQPDKDIKGSR